MENIKVGFALSPSVLQSMSLARLFRNTLMALRENYEVIMAPSTEGNSKKVENEKMIDFLRQLDIAFQAESWFRSAQGLNTPIIFYALGTMPKGGWILLQNQNAYKTGDAIIFSCTADLAIFNKMALKSPLRTYVIPLAVDCHIFTPRTKEEDVATKERFGIPVKSPLLLYVGRINIQKNIHTLLKIFAEVVKKVKDCYLCIVGEEDDYDFYEFNVSNKDYKDYLLSLITKYEISNRVIWAERLSSDDLVNLYSAADIFINCTIHHGENFGFSQVEAMAAGTPVVCSKWGGLKDTVLEGETGFFMDSIMTNNGIKIAWHSGVQHIIHLLENRKLLEKMSRNCVKHANEEYSVKELATNLKNVITTAASSRTSAKSISLGFHPLILEFYLEFIGCLRAHPHDTSRSLLFKKPKWLGDNYKIYRFLNEPYASSVAGENLFPNDAIPYFTADVEFNHNKRLLEVKDPIWLQTYQLEAWQYQLLSQVNGESSVDSILTNVLKQQQDIEWGKMVEFLRFIECEGVICFKENLS